jgi:L-threonylcarbamoyladenylate synthase
MMEADLLKQGGVGVMPTDTLYGLVASASDETAIKRVYDLKGRTASKPCIILISGFDDLPHFGTTLTREQHNVLNNYWPGPVSVILPCGPLTQEYLHRGTQTLAFRIPKDARLRKFLQESGPLIAPSANPEGLPPATTAEEAKAYFGSSVDFYEDGGKRTGEPSTIITFDKNNRVVIVRGNRPM